MFHGITFAPYKLADGGAARWDEIKEEIGERSLEAYRKFVCNLTPDNIVARNVRTPRSTSSAARPTAMVGGDVHGVAPFLYQTVGHRPTPDLGQYTVPGVERLYLVGPFLHPGGGVYGAGRATAIKMFEELKHGLRSRREPFRMKVFGPDGKEIMAVSSIERDGSMLVVKGKIFGAMPMTAKLKPAEVRKALRADELEDTAVRADAAVSPRLKTILGRQ